MPIDDTERPDLEIYSQQLLIDQGQSPDWDSPDIKTNRWNPWRLYDEIPVKVRNVSLDVRAINAEAELFIGPFGIGFERQSVGVQRFHLNAGSEIELLYPLPQTIKDGPPLIATRVELRHPFDEHQGNNKGEQNISGSTTSQDGRNQTITIPVVNNSAQNRQILLGAYQNQLQADVAISEKLFAPNEQYNLSVSLEVPGQIHGTDSDPVFLKVAVYARTGSETLGGVTHIVRVDD